MIFDIPFHSDSHCSITIGLIFLINVIFDSFLTVKGSWNWKKNLDFCTIMIIVTIGRNCCSIVFMKSQFVVVILSKFKLILFEALFLHDIACKNVLELFPKLKVMKKNTNYWIKQENGGFNFSTKYNSTFFYFNKTSVKTGIVCSIDRFFALFTEKIAVRLPLLFFRFVG